MVSLAPREFPASFAVGIGEPAGNDQRHRPDRDAAEQYWGWFPEKAGGAGGEHEQAGPDVRPDGRRFSPVTAQDTAPDTPEESIW